MEQNIFRKEIPARFARRKHNDNQLTQTMKINNTQQQKPIEINKQKSSYPLLFQEFARSKPGTIIKFKILNTILEKTKRNS